MLGANTHGEANARGEASIWMPTTHAMKPHSRRS